MVETEGLINTEFQLQKFKIQLNYLAIEYLFINYVFKLSLSFLSYNVRTIVSPQTL